MSRASPLGGASKSSALSRFCWLIRDARSSAQRRQPIFSVHTMAPYPDLFTSTPRSSSNWITSASPMRADANNGFVSALSSDALAPYSSSSLTIGAAPARPVATRMAVRPSSERALTSAPYSSRSRVISRSSTAHSSAVAPAALRAPGSAPASSSRRTAARSLARNAVISGGVGTGGASLPASASGHSAPSSIHRRMISI